MRHLDDFRGQELRSVSAIHKLRNEAKKPLVFNGNLFEGIANNAILIAHGVTEIEQLPDEDLQIGVLLALLQDDAKNQSHI